MRRVDSVFSAFGKFEDFSSIKRRRVHPEELEETPKRERLEEAASTTGSGNSEGNARYRHQNQRVRTLSRGVEAARGGTQQNVSFDTPFLTGERVQSVKINFSVEKTGNDIVSENGAQFYSEEDAKMVWMHETTIRTFMQLELEACLEEISWMYMITCHNCEALNFPQEEYPARPLPIPPDYIDNLQSRLIKVKKDTLPSTLKMVLKTHYHLPARRPAPTTSPTTVQSDDIMVGHRDVENSPQERPRASETVEKVVAHGTPSTDEGGDFIS